VTPGLVDVGEKDLPETWRFLPRPYRSEQPVGTLRELIGGQLFEAGHLLHAHAGACASAIRQLYRA
jgi:hypothetical protein